MNTDIRIENAKTCIGDGRLDDARKELEGVLLENPDNVYAHFELAKISLIQGNDSASEREYARVLAIDPAFHKARLELARIYGRQGRMEQAIEECRKVQGDDADTVAAYRELGRLCEDTGSPEKALESFEAAARLRPDNTDILFDLAQAYREAGKEQEASGLFRKIIALPEIANDTFMHNKVLNELEITLRKEVLESKPRAMIAMILDRCNIKCRMCSIWAGKWQARDEIIREIVGLFPYMEDICWQGGEVFMMKGFEDVLQEGTRHKNLRQVVFTNGLMINKKILDKLGTGKVDIVFSIDAVDKETYEYIRYGGKYERLISVLELVKEFKETAGSNLKTYFNPVIMKSNYKQLEDFVEFGKKYGFNSITFTPIRGALGNENIFDANDREALSFINRSLPAALAKAKEYGIRLNNWLPGMAGPSDCAQEQQDASRGTACEAADTCAAAAPAKNSRMICYAPWQRLLIDCEGPVRPFGFCESKYIGDVNTMSLAEIWNGEGMRYYRRKIAVADYQDLCRPVCISGQVRDKICRII